MCNTSLNRRRWTWVFLIGLTLICLVGCGGRKTYPVHGTVTFPDGTPLPGGMVAFEPVDSEDKAGARGFIDGEGNFVMGTDKDDNGVAEGEYRVLVEPPLMTVDQDTMPTPKIIHPRYRSFETSPLKYTVKRGTNRYAIKVERP